MECVYVCMSVSFYLTKCPTKLEKPKLLENNFLKKEKKLLGTCMLCEHCILIFYIMYFNFYILIVFFYIWIKQIFLCYECFLVYSSQYTKKGTYSPGNIYYGCQGVRVLNVGTH